LEAEVIVEPRAELALDGHAPVATGAGRKPMYITILVSGGQKLPMNSLNLGLEHLSDAEDARSRR
jgi:hypothetical protein